MIAAMIAQVAGKARARLLCSQERALALAMITPPLQSAHTPTAKGIQSQGRKSTRACRTIAR